MIYYSIDNEYHGGEDEKLVVVVAWRRWIINIGGDIDPSILMRTKSDALNLKNNI